MKPVGSWVAEGNEDPSPFMWMCSIVIERIIYIIYHVVFYIRTIIRVKCILNKRLRRSAQKVGAEGRRRRSAQKVGAEGSKSLDEPLFTMWSNCKSLGGQLSAFMAFISLCHLFRAQHVMLIISLAPSLSELIFYSIDLNNYYVFQFQSCLVLWIHAKVITVQHFLSPFFPTGRLCLFLSSFISNIKLSSLSHFRTFSLPQVLQYFPINLLFPRYFTFNSYLLTQCLQPLMVLIVSIILLSDVLWISLFEAW